MKSLWKPTVMLTGVSLAGMVVGFASSLVTAALFGAGSDLDAYLVAATLPGVVTATLVGSLNLVFIPIFVECRTKGEAGPTWRLASALLNFVFVSLGLVALAGAIYARPLIEWTAPGLPDATRDLAVRLARWTWPAIVAVGVTNLLTGIYQSQERFAWPAVVPILTSVVGVVLTVVLTPSLGVTALAASSLASSLAGAAILSPILASKGRYRLVLASEWPRIASTLRLMVPLTFGRLLSKLMDVVDRYVASGLAVGSVSALSYGKTITGVAGSLVTSGISTTIFPRMSIRAAERDMGELRRTMSLGMRLIAALSFPVIAIGWALGHPLVGTVLERGRFGPDDTTRVAAVLPWYLLTLVGGSLGIVVGKGFYVLKDTVSVAVLSVLDTLLYIVYMPLLARHLGYVGVGVGTAIFWNFSILTTGLVVWYKLGARGGGAFLGSIARMAGASVAGGLAAHACVRWIGEPALAVLLAGGATGLGVYASALWISRSPELEVLVGVARESARKLWSRRGRARAT